MAVINSVSIFADCYTQVQSSGSCFQRKSLGNELPGEEKTNSQYVAGENTTFQDVGDQHKTPRRHPR